MGTNIKNLFGFKNELESILEKYKIDKKDICLVGSIVLGLKNIRTPKDLDICIRSDIRKRLLNKHKDLNKLKSGTINFTSNCQSGLNRYAKIGISDDDLFNNENFYEVIDGYKVAKLEVEFSHKIVRNREKDILDVQTIEKYALNNQSWNWELVNTDYKIGDKKHESQFILTYEKGMRILQLLIKGIKHPKKAIKMIYKKAIKNQSILFFNSVDRSFNSQIILKVPTAALLGNNYSENEFVRYDVILRYLTIESILKGKEEFKDYYNEMQSKRVNRDTYEKLKDLVDSVRKKGFLNRYPIPVTKEGKIIDGAHRLATALYFDIEEVPVLVIPSRARIYYGLGWFKENGFDEPLIKDLEKAKHRLFNEKGIYFIIILWPSVKQYFAEIINNICVKYAIKWHEEMKISNLDDFMRNIYAIDDIEKWKIEKKIHLMEEYGNDICAISIEIPHPSFRLKDRTVSYLSDAGAKLKKEIRQSYKGRIDNYFYDIICHTGDNHEHNREIYNILKSEKNSV